MVGNEYFEMVAIFDWIRFNQDLARKSFHCPNEAKRSPRLGAMMKRMGMLAGVSDIFIAKPKNGFHGFFIEVKAKDAKGKYGKPTESQIRFIEDMREEGYRGEFANGADAAIGLIKDYLGA